MNSTTSPLFSAADQARLDRLEAAFDEAGGRGVDLAEEIDELRYRRDFDFSTDNLVLVLSDGETFGTNEGCSIVAVPGNACDVDDIEAALDAEGGNDPEGAAMPIVTLGNVRVENGAIVVEYRSQAPVPVVFRPAGVTDPAEVAQAVFPAGQVDVDNDGQVVVYTGTYRP